MGIPHYYKHIVTTYCNIETDKIPYCDRLYIDFNSIIHQCASAYVQTAGCSAISEIRNAAIIENVIERTEKIMLQTSPRELVFIGVDGVAPRAKMVQQRKRRYVTAYRNQVIKNIYERHMLPYPSDWDSNTITPGTPFMNMLDYKLSRYFETKKYPFKVMFSGSDQPGEGEQKIFDHLNHLNDLESAQKINVINGLDADLIMLSLLSEHTIYLQREAISPSQYGQYIDIPAFRKSIAHHMDSVNPSKELMWDYVYLCFLLGNDFIPNIPFLKIRDGAVHILIDTYKKAAENAHESHLVLLDENTNLYHANMNLLKEIFRLLAEMERDNMEYAIKHYNDTTTILNNPPNIPENCPRAIRRQLCELEQFPLKNKHVLTSFASTSHSWNARYYEEFFGSHDPNGIKRYCEKYVDGLTWVLNYYFNRRFDKFWHYKFHVAPLCADLYKMLLVAPEEDLKTREKELSKDALDIPLAADLQLMCVIPKTSCDVLPLHLKTLMSDINTGCAHYYPMSFKLCTFMKRFLWECTPILPEIDIVHLNKQLVKQSLPGQALV